MTDHDQMQRAKSLVAAVMHETGCVVPERVAHTLATAIAVAIEASLHALAAALRSQGAQAVPEGLDSALNATVTQLEMIGLGRDPVSGVELSIRDVRRIAKDTRYLLQDAWSKAAAPKPEGR